MSDRVSASITIGGTLAPAQFSELASYIADYDLRVEWAGAPFNPTDLPAGEALQLFGDQVPWGMFEELEEFCYDENLPYQRCSGSCSGSFGAERIVYDGKTEPMSFSVDDDDHLVIHAQTIGQLGSMRAIRRYIAGAEIEIPPFKVMEA